MENGPIEDVFPIEDGDIPASYVNLPEGTWDIRVIFLGFFAIASGMSSATRGLRGHRLRVCSANAARLGHIHKT